MTSDELKVFWVSFKFKHFRPKVKHWSWSVSDMRFAIHSRQSLPLLRRKLNWMSIEKKKRLKSMTTEELKKAIIEQEGK